MLRDDSPSVELCPQGFRQQLREGVGQPPPLSKKAPKSPFVPFLQKEKHLSVIGVADFGPSVPTSLAVRSVGPRDHCVGMFRSGCTLLTFGK